jgi:hypothetical protein
MEVFWFFFSKKTKKKALFFEKRSKNFCPFVATARNMRRPLPDPAGHGSVPSTAKI